MTNLKSLSEHLGLSVATVSRALNNYSTVNAETRDRVLAAATEMNYRPNSSARRLATGKAGAFGIILTTDENLLMDPHFTDFIAGLTQELAAMEHDVVMNATLKRNATATYERFARSGKVDGFVLSAPIAKDPRIATLQKLGMPFVVHGKTESALPYAFYDIDNFGAIRQATELLVQLGHRKIAFINGQTDMVFAVERHKGFIKGLRGLPHDPALISHLPMTEENGYTQMQAMLARGATAVICSSILQAFGAQRAIREAGLTIGCDVSVICHDDALSAMRTENFSVPLTVTRSPIRRAGREIALMLEKLVAGTPPGELQVIAPVDLIVRGSTNIPKS